MCPDIQCVQYNGSSVRGVAMQWCVVLQRLCWRKVGVRIPEKKHINPVREANPNAITGGGVDGGLLLCDHR